ncbi:MAG: 1-acyl-sn-glycerol-3-phosphate acyltransferase [Planctomycetota bacterium]
MTVVFERPYEFVPPIKSTWWPWLIQRLRLYDLHLKRKEGVVGYELRELANLKASLDQGHGILLAPNHCRYADPMVMGWPARELGIHVHAMASWHLFNESWFDGFAIQRMGGFSIFREGNDRQSLEAAIEILVEADRPLIVFPEGTTNRTNDELKPLLDGVAFMARTAAKRRKKQLDAGEPRGSGKVVVHPVAIKYLCVGDFREWALRQLDVFERQLGWHRMPERDLLGRTLQLVEAQLALKETQYLGCSRGGPLPERRDFLIREILEQTEKEMKLSSDSDCVRARVRQIRSTASSRFFEGPRDSALEAQLRRNVAAADLTQDLSSFPNSYLREEDVTDTRLIETIQRLQESINGKSDNTIELKAVVEFAPAIEVDTSRPPRGAQDPMMTELEDNLQSMVRRLAGEANRFVT